MDRRYSIVASCMLPSGSWAKTISTHDSMEEAKRFLSTATVEWPSGRVRSKGLWIVYRRPDHTREFVQERTL